MSRPDTMPTDQKRFPDRGGLLPQTGLLLLLLAAMLAAGCGDAEGGNESSAASEESSGQVIPVDVRIVEPVTFRDVIQQSGSVEAQRDATISAETSGRVKSLATRGTKVREGQVVAAINDRMLESSLKAIRSRYELAEKTFQKKKALYRDSIISQLRYENALTQRDQARARYEQAREKLRKARPRSPFKGRVEEHFVEAGEFVNPGRPLLRIVNTRRMKITAGVPERYVGDIRVGASADVRFRTERGGRRTGKVTFAGRAINPSDRTFPVEIALDNKTGQLSPDMIADLYITRAVIEDALVVPQAAVLRDEDVAAVFAVEKQEDRPIAVRRKVELGPSSEGRTVVRSGLETGDRVVTSGQSQLTDGAPVRVVSSSRPTVTDAPQTVGPEAERPASDQSPASGPSSWKKKAPAPEQKTPASDGLNARPKSSAPNAGAAHFTVQVGAFQSEKNAQQLVRKMQKAHYPAYVKKKTASGRQLYAVCVGKYATSGDARAMVDTLRAQGHQAVFKSL